MIEFDFGCIPNLSHIFECGQCFRWNEQDDGSYIGVAGNEVVQAHVDGSKIILHGTENFNFWSNYFDISFDYENVKSRLAKDKVLKKCIGYGFGIRILQQDLFETIISFIISANNNIPRIKGIIERLCKLCGEQIGESEHYTFPTAEQIVNAGLDKLSTIGAGYRDKYIYETAKTCLHLVQFGIFPPLCTHDTQQSVQTSNRTQIQTYFEDLSTPDARRELLKFHGVGPKVADCILLFGLRRFDAFPTDVWVKRLMNEAYNVSPDEIASFAEQNFGELQGLAQQYLFYYFRENTKR